MGRQVIPKSVPRGPGLGVTGCQGYNYPTDGCYSAAMSTRFQAALSMADRLACQLPGWFAGSQVHPSAGLPACGPKDLPAGPQTGRQGCLLVARACPRFLFRRPKARRASSAPYTCTRGSPWQSTCGPRMVPARASASCPMLRSAAHVSSATGAPCALTHRASPCQAKPSQAGLPGGSGQGARTCTAENIVIKEVVVVEVGRKFEFPMKCL